MKYFIILIFFIFSKQAFSNNSEIFYMNYLNNCSDGLSYAIPYKPDDNDFSTIMFVGKNLDTNCLQDKYVSHHQNNQLLDMYDNQPIDVEEVILRKKTEHNTQTITSLDKYVCIESCRIIDDYILTEQDTFYYITDSLGYAGFDSKFISQEKILIKTYHSTHSRNVVFDTVQFNYEYFGQGDIEFNTETYTKSFIKSYANYEDKDGEWQLNGAFWWNAKFNYEHEIVELINMKGEYSKCWKKDYFKLIHKIIYEQMIAEGIEEFCVNR